MSRRIWASLFMLTITATGANAQIVVVDPGNLRTGQAVRVAPAPAPPASRAEADSGP